MTLLPIVGRELRIRARRASTYWFRVSAATAALLLVLLVNVSMGKHATSVQLGLAFFHTLAWAALFLCLIAGMVNTCDCVSEERREGTLGLLFLTDLKGFDIVFGKLAATSLNAVFSLVAIFPLLAIPLVMGGLEVDRLLRTLASLANALFFSLAIGMAVSTISQKERRALSATLLTVLFFTVGLPILAWILDDIAQFGASDMLVEKVLIPSPSFTLAMASSDAVVKASARGAFVTSFLLIHAMGWGLLLFSCRTLPNRWKDRPASAAGLRLRARWKQWCYGTGEERKAFQRRLQAVNSFFWVAARDRIKPTVVWGVFGVMGALWFWAYLEDRRGWIDQTYQGMTLMVCYLVLKVWIAMEACHRFGEDRRSGALELLLATPLSVAEILEGQTLALRRQFYGPALFTLAVNFIFVLVWRDDRDWVLMVLAGMVVFVVDAVALAWLGMWLGLRARHGTRATWGAIWRILVLPWLIYFMTFLMIEIPSGGPNVSEEGFAAIWFAIGLAFSLFFGLDARTRLHAEFRHIATQQAGVGKGK